MPKQYIERRNEELQERLEKVLEKNKELKRKVNYDDLTGLLRRDKFDQVLSNIMQRSDRLNSPLSYLLVDIDNFKKINDTYGHDEGDYVLKEVAKVIKETVRDKDILCRDFVGRYGGEEMSIFLTGTDKAGAMIAGERIRKAVEDRFKDEKVKVTISLGNATYSPREEPRKNYTMEISDLAKEADKNLYKAKKSGKNRVVY